MSVIALFDGLGALVFGQLVLGAGHRPGASGYVRLALIGAAQLLC
jgi:hypothetical protein